MEVAQQYIRSQYSTLANGNLKSISKAQLYYSIITIKTDHPALANEYQSLYKDVKMFIEAKTATIRHWCAPGRVA